jgi:succinyl-diaminopimelate desuccinylase
VKSVIEITQELIRFPSITPHEAGCLDFIQSLLEANQFTCHRLLFGEVDNLYARWGQAEPNFCFAGHVDVVPPGERGGWITDPFKGDIIDDVLYGRGVVDMKGAIGAFLSAVIDFVQHNPFKGSISLLLTCDEEGPASHGTKRVLEWLRERDEKLTVCLVGEPTNLKHVGDMVKIGRRGSLNGIITVFGKAGHVAYPNLAQNPIPVLLTYLQALMSEVLDGGNEYFDPSNLEVTSIDVGNASANVIPDHALARFNIRFNPKHTVKSLRDLLANHAEKLIPLAYDLCLRSSGEAFYCPDEALQALLKDSIIKICGRSPIFSTTGGTSDARYIKDYCPVIEFGLVSESAHHANEQIAVSELVILTRIYHEVLQRYFQV